MDDYQESDLPEGLANTDDPRKVLHECLSSPRRRYVIEELCYKEGELTLRDIATSIVNHEHTEPMADVPDEDVEAVYISLYHTHIPMLDESGIVNYDSDRGIVKLIGDADWWSQALQMPDYISE